MFRKDTKFGASAALIVVVGQILMLEFCYSGLLPLRALRDTEKPFCGILCFQWQ